MMDLYILSVIVSFIVFLVTSYIDKKNGAIYKNGTCVTLILLAVSPGINAIVCLLILLTFASKTEIAQRLGDWLNKEI